MQHTEIIKNLKKLKLSSYPYEDVRNLLLEIGELGIVNTYLHKGKKIIRARINKNDECFDTISSLSYKPQKYNTTYQRASTPYQTMFYGSIVPTIKGRNEPETARFTALYEISKFILDGESVGKQKITFSVWEVINDIKLISLLHHREFKRPPKLLNRIQREYRDFISKYPDIKTKSIELTSFLGEQFAKYVDDNDYEYMISAVFSELMLEHGYDGILYPSVQLAGEGMNIAISPKSVENSLSFIHSGECTLYKNKQRAFLGNDTHAIFMNNGRLKYEKAPSSVYVSEFFGLKQVGLI